MTALISLENDPFFAGVTEQVFAMRPTRETGGWQLLLRDVSVQLLQVHHGDFVADMLCVDYEPTTCPVGYTRLQGH